MLLTFLGPFIYWPIAIALIGFCLTSVVSNVSMVYSEIWHQVKELKRVIK